MEAALRFSYLRSTGLAPIHIYGNRRKRMDSCPSSRIGGRVAFRPLLAALLAAFLSFRPCR